jgi:raffinose/stachyose/melibiose transport system permease protein
MRVKKFIFELVVVLFSFIYIIPAWMVFVNSLKPRLEANKFGLGLPSVFMFQNYIKVFMEGDIARSFINGVFIATTSVACVIIISSMAAFYISRSKTKTAVWSYYYFISGLLIPVALIPSYIILLLLKLNNTYEGLIFMFVTYCLPVSIFLYTGFIKTISGEIDEASIIDGCGTIRMFFQIIFPLLKPATITVLVINFVGVWNDITTQLYFASSDKWTMPMTVYKFYGMYLSDWNLVFADVIITIIPVLLVYIFAQKFLVTGMMAGAVKG